MTNQEKSILVSMAGALTLLPDGKKEYLLGFAEGVQARDELRKTEGQDRCKPSKTNPKRAG